MFVLYINVIFLYVLMFVVNRKQSVQNWEMYFMRKIILGC